MIDADIRGKLRRDSSSAHDRSEDLLTSTVFGLLRYLPMSEALKPLIEGVRSAEDLLSQQLRDMPRDCDSPWINLTGAASCDILFWPSFGEWGQPDILLTFRDATKKPIHLVVVEAKLHSPKSGEASDEDDANAEIIACDMQWHPDQLVRYWRGLADHADLRGSNSSSVVYLTAHSAPPLSDLTASLKVDPKMRLGWISWRHIWDVVLPLAGGDETSCAATDLERLLAYRGFRSLNAFKTIPPISIKSTERFWQQRRWFSALALPTQNDRNSFWESK
jgi:hypothetical protein